MQILHEAFWKYKLAPDIYTLQVGLYIIFLSLLCLIYLESSLDFDFVILALAVKMQL